MIRRNDACIAIAQCARSTIPLFRVRARRRGCTGKIGKAREIHIKWHGKMCSLLFPVVVILRFFFLFFSSINFFLLYFYSNPLLIMIKHMGVWDAFASHRKLCPMIYIVRVRKENGMRFPFPPGWCVMLLRLRRTECIRSHPVSKYRSQEQFQLTWYTVKQKKILGFPSSRVVCVCLFNLFRWIVLDW